MNIKSLLQGALILSLTVLLTSQDALAQGAGTTRAKKKDSEQPANEVGAQTAKILTAAYDFITKNQNAQARTALAELKMDKLSPYEKGRAETIFFTLDYQEEKYDSARKHMEAAIASGGLNDVEISNDRYQLAQLWVQQEKWKEGAAAIEDWLKTAKNPNGSVYYLLAICYNYMENFDAALPNSRKAVESSDKPREEWLSLNASLLLNKERYKDALPIMERLVNSFPAKKIYWTQLSGIYTNLDDNKNALVIQQLAYHAGLLTEANELQRLADLMAAQEMPYSAATFMQKAMEDKKIPTDQKAWKKLSDFYRNAREFKKAIGALENSAKLSESGVDYFNIGEMNVQLSQWEPAAAALQKALEKGGVRDVPFTQYYLGIALFSQKKYTEAKAVLEKIPANTPNGKNAKSYIQLINSKIR